MNKGITKLNIVIVVLFALMLGMLIISLRGTKADTTTAITRAAAEQAVIDEAYAFYYRTTRINYDDYSMTYFDGEIPSSLNASDPDYNSQISYKLWKQRTSYFQPEEATSQEIKYLNCGEFAVNIFYNAFADASGKKFILAFNNPTYSAMFNGDMVWGTYRFMSIAKDHNNPLHALTKYFYNLNEALQSLKYEMSCSGDNCYTKLDTFIQESLKNQIYSLDLRPGDVIVTRNRPKCSEIASCGDSVSGHIMIYVGKPSPNGTMPDEVKNGYVLHSTGMSYQYDSKYDSSLNESDGTVQRLTLDEALNRAIKSGVDSSTVTIEFAIIRPIDAVLENGSYLVSEDAQNRRTMPDLVREKMASVNEHDSVNPGDSITYTIELENKSSQAYSGINIADKVPTNTEYVSCTNNCTKDGSNITWSNISLAANEKKVFEFKVKVKETATLGSVIVSDKTVVADIKMNTIKTTVNKTLTSDMQSSLVSRVKTTLKDKVYGENDNSFAFIKDAYASTPGINFGGTVYVQTLFTKFFNITSNDVYALKANMTEDKFTKMYVDGLFGGYYTTSENQYTLDSNALVYSNQYPVLYDGRERTYDDNTLMIGDVVLVYDTNFANESYAYRKYNAYLYLGYNSDKQVVEFATINEDKKVVVLSSKLGSTNRSRLLESLMGQNAFIVLRPSYSMTDTKGDVNNDGTIDIKDAMILAKYIIEGTSSYTNAQLLMGDMNNDGNIKMNDVIKLLKSL